ncbi:MAG: hypothetical protein BroJett040_24330 [Oligoflexia bacterium]|nr:MAG: hypothetical protein BroJett040_24330 [Oligoflexia bacterium]
MKTLIVTLAMMVQLSANAMTKAEAAQLIQAQVQKLGKIAYGFDVQTVKGKNAHEMLINFVAKDQGEKPADVQLVNKEAKDIAFGDEIETGFTSMKSAIELIGNAESDLEQYVDDSGLEPQDPQLRQKRAKLKLMKTQWAPAIMAMRGTNVQFGYDGHGPGYCGVSFVRLLVIDPNSQKIYFVYLSQSGEC